MSVPESVSWISKILWTLPSPNDAWVTLITGLAWPAVTVFLILRFKRFLSQFLNTLLDRLKTDDIKTSFFELTANSPVYVLDPEKVGESTETFSPEDTQRIELIFEFMDEPGGFDRICAWLREKYAGRLTLDEFVTDPDYAKERIAAFEEIAGLEL